MSGGLSFVAGPDDAGRRLDLVLSARLDRSRSACAALIKQGMVRVDGRAAKAAHIVASGERVETTLPPPVEPSARPEHIPLAIVYRDDDIAVIDKPAGMATHPAPGSPRGTLVNALLAALGPLPAINGVLRPGIVHRLDKDTSGLIVVATSERAMRALSKAIAQREVRRDYVALVWGAPSSPSGVIDAPIGRDPTARTKFAVREDGKRAVTRYRVAERFPIGTDKRRRAASESNEITLLALRLVTGRTHQIRVHCAAIGHPIVGDALYGPGRPDLGVHRQMLHAARLSFVHPVTAEPMSFEAPLPSDFAALVERLRSGVMP